MALSARNSAIVRPVGSAPWVRALLIGVGLLLTAIFLIVPVILIFVQALSLGFETYRDNILHEDTLHAIWLSILTALVVVPINVIFGVCAAWLVTKYTFPGRKLLITLIEIPFSISPIIAGVTYLFLYGDQGLLGSWLYERDLQVMFTIPAIFLVSLFVTCPFVARELIPLMQTQGSDEEQAAISLGAGGFVTFLKVTLPNIKWALLYGAILCNARVLGEFGAVSIVSGNIRGETNTLPLHIELLYNDYNAVGAFAAASTLTFVAVLTMIVKTFLERKTRG